MLHPLFIGISIVENPFIARQIAAVPIWGHDVLTNDLNFFRAVFVEVKGVPVRRVLGPGEDVAVVTPNEVGGMAVAVDETDIFAVE
jgi:hypothetical protein